MPSLRPYASFALELFVTSIAPARCVACERRVPLRTIFCRACAETLVEAPAGSPGSVSGFLYGAAIERAIVRLKFESREELAAPLADALWGVVSRARLQVDLVVPVPLHPMRLVERGYNQAALLARPIATRLGAPFADGALVRTRNTKHQVGQGRGDRLANLSGAIAVRDPERVRNARVLVVDDVITTGATLEACREALTRAGAAGVTFLTLAVAAL